jgi:glycosyltransferase involved in cell wall biosynthesis
MTRKRRVLWVGRTRYRLPLAQGLARKWAALADEFEVRVVASSADGTPGDGTFALVRPLPGAAFYAVLPFVVAREIRRFRPDAVLAESPFEASMVLLARVLARRRPRLVVDVHGDWRTATRLYGSQRRRLLAPLADRVAAGTLRRADAVRTISTHTTELVAGLGLEPAATFVGYSDLGIFADPPVEALPARPRAIFVGVLERYKDVEGLARAWRLAAPRLPGIVLHVVGRGTQRAVVESLRADLPDQVEWDEWLEPEQVVSALDRATVLVLPSPREGLGRVVVEALLRGRPVIGTRAGGVPDVVRDGVNGLLVEPLDPPALADALVRVLSQPEEAKRLAAPARESAAPWLVGPEEFAARTRALVEHALA